VQTVDVINKLININYFGTLTPWLGDRKGLQTMKYSAATIPNSVLTGPRVTWVGS